MRAPSRTQFPVIASDSPWKRRGGRTQTQYYSLYITNRVWEERLRGGTRTLVSPSTNFPAFAGVNGVSPAIGITYHYHGPRAIGLER